MSTPTLIDIPELSSASDTFVTLRRDAAAFRPQEHAAHCACVQLHGFAARQAQEIPNPRISVDKPLYRLFQV